MFKIEAEISELQCGRWSKWAAREPLDRHYVRPRVHIVLLSNEFVHQLSHLLKRLRQIECRIQHP